MCSVRDDSDIGNRKNDSNEGAAVGVRIDFENFCWSWTHIDQTLTLNDNALSYSSVLKSLLCNDINLIQDTGYGMRSSSI